MKATGYQDNLPIEDEKTLHNIELCAPIAQDHDILVAVKAVSVNPADTKVLQNMAPIVFIINWEVSGFSMPESVLASTNHEWLYVSNVNGNSSGYISRMSKEGKVDDFRWAKGLGSPTGMGMFEGKPYGADQQQFCIIDVKNGKLLKSVAAPEAKMLNDLAVSKDGQDFISDIFDGKIYTLQDENLVIWLGRPRNYPNERCTPGQSPPRWGIVLHHGQGTHPAGHLFCRPGRYRQRQLSTSGLCTVFAGQQGGFP